MRKGLFISFISSIVIVGIIDSVSQYLLHIKIISSQTEQHILCFSPLIGLLFFGLFIWICMRFMLISLVYLAHEIANRTPTHLKPLSKKVMIPAELQPIVTEFNQLLFHLQTAFESSKRFAADAAHELRTPLAALKTHAQVALKIKTEIEKTKALQHIIESVDRCSHIIAQLLILNRVSAEDALSDLKPINIYAVATEVIAHLASLALEKQIDIELAPPPSHTMILGNDIAMSIMIRNIVDNAIRYTNANGAITIVIIEESAQIIFRVIDSGIGIPNELRDRVFERFFRIANNQAPGSGLGLSIVKQITTLHHAEITLKTPSTGIGLQFDVIFPKCPVSLYNDA